MAITREFGCIKCGYSLSATSPDDINIEIHRSEPVVSSIEMEIPCINSSCRHLNKLWWSKFKPT